MARAVKEWKGKTDDTPIPTRVKLRIVMRYQSICQHCFRDPSLYKYVEIDHINALVNGGENRETNLQPLCDVCHKIKTKKDVAEKALVARQRKSHILQKEKKKSSFKGWRNFKGQPVWAEKR